MKPTSQFSSKLPLNKPDFPATAMIFAAGLGSRMRPLTDSVPKPLARVAGKALIDYALDDLAQAGVKTAIVNVHHLADQIEAHLAGRELPHIVISDERELLLDQGGGIKRVLPHFGGKPFFICNTDAFWSEAGAANLRALAGAWDADKMDAALLLAPTAGSIGVDWDGDFDLGPEGRILNRRGPDVTSIPAWASSSPTSLSMSPRMFSSSRHSFSMQPNKVGCSASPRKDFGCTSAR